MEEEKEENLFHQEESSEKERMSYGFDIEYKNIESDLGVKIELSGFQGRMDLNELLSGSKWWNRSLSTRTFHKTGESSWQPSNSRRVFFCGERI